MLADEMATVQSERLVQSALARWAAKRLIDARLISHLKNVQSSRSYRGDRQPVAEWVRRRKSWGG